jgi:hypothetical protein
MIIVVAPLTVAVLFVAITLFVLKRSAARDREKSDGPEPRA